MTPSLPGSSRQMNNSNIKWVIWQDGSISEVSSFGDLRAAFSVCLFSRHFSAKFHLVFRKGRKAPPICSVLGIPSAVTLLEPLSASLATFLNIKIVSSRPCSACRLTGALTGWATLSAGWVHPLCDSSEVISCCLRHTWGFTSSEQGYTGWTTGASLRLPSLLLSRLMVDVLWCCPRYHAWPTPKVFPTWDVFPMGSQRS